MRSFSRRDMASLCGVVLLAFVSSNAFADPCVSDGDCDDGNWCNGEETCRSGTCAPGTDPCAGTGEACVERFDICCHDNDRDGRYDNACGGDDCDDDDPQRFPGNAERCDEDYHDEDCNALTYGSSLDVDLDFDGWDNANCCNIASDGTLFCGDDCDDANPAVSPAQNEVCNNIDDDCNGLVDDGVMALVYTDNDGDGFGDPTEALDKCPGTPGFSVLGNDCDDENPAIVPGAMICNEDFSGIYMCQDGEYHLYFCDTENKEHCVPQPNGTGLCIPKKAKLKKEK